MRRWWSFGDGLQVRSCCCALLFAPRTTLQGAGAGAALHVLCEVCVCVAGRSGRGLVPRPLRPAPVQVSVLLCSRAATGWNIILL